jgi:hypothetical protein
MFALLVQFDVRPRLAALLSLGLVVSPPLLVAILRIGRSVDPLSSLVMTLGCLFIVRRRRLALTVTLVLGVAVKETALFLIPLAYAVWAERLVDRRALRDALLVAVAPLAGYALLRASIAAVGSQYTPEFRGSFLHVRLSSLGKAFSGVELRRLAYTYGPLWLAAPFALRTVPFARRGLVLVALCVLALTVSFDAGRVLFIAAPVVYVAAASAVRERRALAALLVIALFALDAGYGAYMEAYGLTHGLQTGVSHVPVY